MYRILAAACLAVSFHVLAQTPCTHLGENVVCPPGITPGSGSVSFTPDGILWSDGNESVGQNPAPFVDMPGSSPGSGAGLQSGIEDVTVEEQLGLTSDPGGESIRPRRRATSFEWPDEAVIVDLVMTHGAETLAREFATGDAGERSRIRAMLYLSDYIDDSPPPGSREALRDTFHETGDLAGAATALADGSIKYDQATGESIMRTAIQVGGDENSATTKDVRTRLQNQFVGMAPNDQVIFTTRANCYEFVHLAAYFAGAGRGPVNTSTGVDNLIDASTREIWDGSSDIPAGKVVIGAVWNNTLSDATKQAEIGLAREKQAIIDWLTGSEPRPADLSAEAETYQKFLHQLAGGVAGDKPFFYTSFRVWSEQYNQPPPALETISAGPRPPPPPEGRETAILIADWFNLEEAGNLGIPPQGP